MLGSLQDLQDSAKKLLSDNATVILTAGGVVGTVTTAVLTARASFKAAEILEEERLVRLAAMPPQEQLPSLPEIDTKTKIFLVWPHFVPPVITGGATIASIIMAHRMSAQKAAAMAALYGLSQRQLEEYKEKVAQTLTGPKNQKLKDEIAEDRVKNNPPSSQIIVVEGKVLCFDAPTGRYFQSTMEDIKKAVNATNSAILQRDGISASYFYEQLGLPSTTWTDDVGWDSLTQVDLDYSTIMAYNDQPCIVIDFRVLPKADWSRTY
jgi:hypothetical protein